MKYRFTTRLGAPHLPGFGRCGLSADFRNLLIMAFAVAILLTSAAFAETLTGTVTNGTTSKPSTGDDVVLLTLSQGMQESGRTKTNAQGKFSFDLTDPGGPHLVRVTHQGVNYFPAGGPIRPGTTSTEIQVFDAAKKLEGVNESVHLMRLQADQNSLQVIELISVRNGSMPKRTLMADRTWDIYLPEGAQVDQSAAQGPGGMPVNSAPVPDDKVKGKYYFVFPIRPGETRFQVAYHLPYSGEATFKPKIAGKIEHFAIMMPKSMEFGAKAQGVYSPTPDETGQSVLQVATAVTPDKDLSFRVAGTGMLADEQAQGGQQPPGESGGTMGGGATGPRPGGGLGTPEGTPDPIHKYRWAILAGCLALLAAGGGFVVSRKQPAALEKAAVPSRPAKKEAAVPTAPAVEAPASGSLLQGLKEELFALEVERQQGRISDAEYRRTKSALDQTLQRALQRAKSTART